VDLLSKSTVGSTAFLLRGHGDGTTASLIESIPGSDGTNLIQSAKLDSDSIDDAVLVTGTDARLVYGGFGSAAPSAVPLPMTLRGFLRSVAVCDVDEDGNPDIVALASIEPPGSSPSAADFFVFTGDGARGFTPASTFEFTPGLAMPGDMVTLDANEDGFADILTFGSDGIFLAAGDGTGRFAAPFPVISAGPGYPTGRLGDFDGDGRTDIAYFPDVSGLGIFLGDGTGLFTRAATIPIDAGG
jgi:hypothetical protein